MNNRIPPIPMMLHIIGNIPTSYAMAMSYEEQLLCLKNYICEIVVPTMNENITDIQALITYINNYFDNLDLQEEVNIKINELVEDGTLANIINDELLSEINQKYNTLDAKVDNNYNSLYGDIVNQGVQLSTQIANQGTQLNNAINTQNLVIANNNYEQNEKIEEIDERVSQIISSTPIVVDNTSAMTDTSKIYVLSTDGKWYYYNGTTWVAGGTYQASVNPDSVDLINKQLKMLSMNYALNKYEVDFTNSPTSANILPFTKTATNSSSFAMQVNCTTQLYCSHFQTNPNKYYFLYAELERLIDDTTTQGYATINPYIFPNMNTNPTYSWVGCRNNVPMTVEKGVKTLCTFGFKTSSVVDIAPILQWLNTNTTEKTTSYKIHKVGIIEYDSQSEVENTYNNCLNYIEQLGLVIPNDKYGNNKTLQLENRIDNMDIPDYDTDIIFWGDSLTQGAGGSGVSFPSVVGSLLNKEIINCGVGGETSTTILARQGSITPVIPAGANTSSFILKDIFGYNIDPLIQGNIGVNPIKIDNDNTEYTLVRNSDGTYAINNNETPISSANYPRFIRFAGNDIKGRITVFFVGQNGQGGDTLINEIRTAIKNTNGKVVVMGLTTGTTSSRSNLVNKLKNEFGSKFFDSGYYLSQFGLNVVNLAPTSEDTQAIAEGSIPPSLRVDNTHLNANGYTALGTLLSHFIANLYY